MRPRRPRRPLPINQHTPPLTTSSPLPTNTTLLPLLQRLLQDLIIKRPRLQPDTLDPQPLRLFKHLFCNLWRRDDRDGCFCWVGKERERGEGGVRNGFVRGGEGGDGGGRGVDGRCGEIVRGVPVEYCGG